MSFGNRYRRARAKLLRLLEQHGPRWEGFAKRATDRDKRMKLSGGTTPMEIGKWPGNHLLGP